MSATHFPSRSGLFSELYVVDNAEESTRTLVPHIGLVAGVRYRGETVTIEDGRERDFPMCSLRGLHHDTRHVRSSADGGIILATLRPDVAYRFIGDPLDGIFGTICALEDLFGRQRMTTLANRLQRASSNAERATIFEGFFASLVSAAPCDPILDRAVGEIQASFGNIRIKDLARRVGLSQDALEKRFRRAVGSSPKQLASLVRFRRSMALFAQGRTLTQVACEAGYSDQSHFIRAFRAVTGKAPREFLTANAHC